MADIGTLGGLTYRMDFPSQSQQMTGGQPIAQQPVQVAVPEFENDPLAAREKLTSDYYNSMSMLRSFAQDMASKGIDPFKPDYSQEGGGLAFQTMQKLQAGLMYSANALSNEFKAEQQMRPLEARGDYRLKQGVAREGLYYSNPENFYSTALDPRTIEANKRTSDNFYTDRDVRDVNNSVYDPNLQGLGNTYSGEELEYQRSGAFPATRQTSYQQLVPRRGSGDNDYQIALLRKYTNLKNGVWSPGTFTQISRGGKVFLKNEEGKGDVLGKYQANTDKNGSPILKDKVVDYWLQDPETGKVFIKFTDPNLPLQEVSNQSGDSITREFVSNNSKYGSVDKIMEAATSMGLTNAQGQSVDQFFMPQNFQEIQGNVRGQANTQAVAEKYNVVRNELQSITNPSFLGVNFGNDFKIYNLPDGRQVEIAKHKSGNKFFIKNWEDLGFTEEPKNLSIDEALAYLDDFQYFDKFLNSQSAPQPVTPRAQQAIDAFTKQFGRQPSASETQKILAKYK